MTRTMVSGVLLVVLPLIVTGKTGAQDLNTLITLAEENDIRLGDIHRAAHETRL